MCGKCEGQPYRGVGALFNADLQRLGRFEDRKDWQVFSPAVAIHIGQSMFETAENPLFRACNEAIDSLTVDERMILEALSKQTGRPAFGRP